MNKSMGTLCSISWSLYFWHGTLTSGKKRVYQRKSKQNMWTLGWEKEIDGHRANDSKQLQVSPNMNKGNYCSTCQASQWQWILKYIDNSVNKDGLHHGTERANKFWGHNHWVWTTHIQFSKLKDSIPEAKEWVGNRRQKDSNTMCLLQCSWLMHFLSLQYIIFCWGLMEP